MTERTSSTAGRDQRKVFVPAPGSTAPPAAPPRRPSPQRPRSPGPDRRPPTPAAAPPAKERRGRRRWPLVLTALGVIFLLAIGGSYLWANSVFNRVHKVPVASVLSPRTGAGTNYLIVGSDSRAVVDPNAPDASAFNDGTAPGGQRSDTMLVLRIEGGHARMLSIPRDLEVKIADTGRVHKINSAYNGGATRLIKTIQDSVGIPIHHYLEVDFASFQGLVDSLGGITINFPHPAFDKNSGLNVTTAGSVKLDGKQAIAYVRSRYYTEVIDGKNKRDYTGDLGRVVRQQQFLRTVLGKLGRSRNPFALAKSANAVSRGIRIDDTFTMPSAMKLGWRLKGLNPVAVEVPTVAARDSNGAVLRPGPGFADVIAQFG